jgi:FkbM family methyltransferase
MVVLATLLIAAPAAHAACRSPKNICKHFDDCLQRTNHRDADGIRAGVKARNGQIVLAGAEACAREWNWNLENSIATGTHNSEPLMTLSLPERLAMLMPPSVFYRRRIAQEARTGEPELALLAELVPRGGIAVDVGANVGFFAYALADIADRVLAFEPNPDYAFFARWMLRDRAEVHEVALSDASGRGTLYVPLSDQGVLLHLAGSLKRSHFQFRNIKTYDVEIRTLDEVGLAGVRFVKADVEGGEREVLDGARATIARDRPIILLELLSGTHNNPAAETAAICETFGYEAFIVQRGEKIAAMPAIIALGKNTSWGTDIESRNVLFLPQ